MAAEKQIHEGHRSRMYARVEREGLDGLAPHEVLEYLLYFTNARRDTNALAHALLDRFGDFASVLEASEEELMQVKGIGPATARMLHSMLPISRYYARTCAGKRRSLCFTARMTPCAPQPTPSRRRPPWDRSGARWCGAVAAAPGTWPPLR